jgi:hypothetical protein
MTSSNGPSLTLPIARYYGARKIRQGLVGDDGAGISFDQGLGNFFVIDFRDRIARRRENWDTFFHFMRVSGEDVGDPMFEKP